MNESSYESLSPIYKTEGVTENQHFQIDVIPSILLIGKMFIRLFYVILQYCPINEKQI